MSSGIGHAVLPILGAATGAFFGGLPGAAVGASLGGAADMIANPPKMPVMPPFPFMPQAQVDQRTQDAEAEARKKQGIAGGIESTVGAGTSGMLNPATVSSKTLLGE